jgi:polyisoprenoid-binding protein YceI
MIDCLRLAAIFSAVLSASAIAAPVTYKIDSGHTYPSFEADHAGGLSIWRGKFNSTSGTIVLDREAKSGSLDVTIDAASIDFGHDKMNEHAKSPDMFDVAQYPTVNYTGKLTNFENDAPTTVEGSLTLHGVTKPLTLAIDRFKCMINQRTGKEVCGANAVGKFNREDFGVSYGKDRGFFMDVALEIQVEAIRQE